MFKILLVIKYKMLETFNHVQKQLMNVGQKYKFKENQIHSETLNPLKVNDELIYDTKI